MKINSEGANQVLCNGAGLKLTVSPSVNSFIAEDNSGGNTMFRREAKPDSKVICELYYSLHNYMGC